MNEAQVLKVVVEHLSQKVGIDLLKGRRNSSTSPRHYEMMSIIWVLQCLCPFTLRSIGNTSPSSTFFGMEMRVYDQTTQALGPTMCLAKADR